MIVPELQAELSAVSGSHGAIRYIPPSMMQFVTDPRQTLPTGYGICETGSLFARGSPAALPMDSASLSKSVHPLCSLRPVHTFPCHPILPSMFQVCGGMKARDAIFCVHLARHVRGLSAEQLGQDATWTAAFLPPYPFSREQLVRSPRLHTTVPAHAATAGATSQKESKQITHFWGQSCALRSYTRRRFTRSACPVQIPLAARSCGRKRSLVSRGGLRRTNDRTCTATCSATWLNRRS